MRVDVDVIAVLEQASVSVGAVALVGALDRKLYDRTNRVLEAAGGRWDRKAKAHLFESDAVEAVEQILANGQVTSLRQDLGQFFTPEPLARSVVARAQLEPGMSLLEPSAGRGALAAPAQLLGCSVTCVELDKRNVDVLCATLFSGVVHADFLEQPPSRLFDRVVMNPPFGKRADIHHVRHALRFLKPGGRLVAIMSAGVRFRNDTLTSRFRDDIDRSGGSIEPLPEDSFKTAGTFVGTALVTVQA